MTDKQTREKTMEGNRILLFLGSVYFVIGIVLLSPIFFGFKMIVDVAFSF